MSKDLERISHHMNDNLAQMLYYMKIGKKLNLSETFIAKPYFVVAET